MAIVKEELLLYKSQIINNTGTNGGRSSINEIVSGLANNIWPDITESERTIGSSIFRKVFYKVANAANLTLFDTGVFLENFTPADDRILWFPGTHTDTASDLTGSERLYSCGWLTSQANSGVTTFDVTVEDPTDIQFFDGDSVRLSDKTDPNDAGGNSEVHIIIGTPSIAGSVVTIIITQPLVNTYASGVGSRVQAVHNFGEIKTAYSNVALTSASGTFDGTQIGMTNIGTVYEEITVTFTSATAFDCVGDTLGALGSGTIGTLFSAINPTYGQDYFSLPATIWGGTFATNDTIVFVTEPAEIPIWENRIVPAGASSFAGNSVSLGLLGASSG